MKKEKCGYGCGRDWDEVGGENGFENCVSAYHIPEKNTCTCSKLSCDCPDHAKDGIKS